MKNLLTTILTLSILLNPLSALASVEGQERGVISTPTHQEVAPPYFAALRDGGTTSPTKEGVYQAKTTYCKEASAQIAKYVDNKTLEAWNASPHEKGAFIGSIIPDIIAAKGLGGLAKNTGKVAKAQAGLVGTLKVARTVKQEWKVIKTRIKDEKVLSHIFNGNITKSGKNAEGFHLIFGSTGKAHITKVLTEPNKYGVYKAEVEVFNPNTQKWVAKIKKGINGKVKNQPSTFFPDSWTENDVVKAVNVAFENIVDVDGLKKVGKLKNGMKIEMIIKDGKIITAYPLIM